MCGIAGFTRFFGSPGDESTLREMGRAIAHRGPDASGEYLDSGVGLSHRRLSIIDLSASGNQPMVSGDGKLVIVFNGEIYNYRELRQELVESGYAFKTQTDTEVILALYASRGSDCLGHLNGMFAFALWDTERKILFIARDRLGKKPLYYYDDGRYFVFASEIKALLVVPAVRRELRTDAVYDFFAYQYIPDPKTIFRNIHKLEPGHFLIASRDGIDKSRYWDVSFADVSTRSETELADDLLSVARESVKRRMISDVPLGAFLSGGIDSSGVVGLMAAHSSKPVTTCSIGFNLAQFDELEFARLVARKFATDHHEFIVEDDIEGHLPEIAAFFDEPFADESIVPTYFVSKLARQRVTVALAGDGGDEVFAGYEKYVTDRTENRLRRCLPGLVRQTCMPRLARLLSRNDATIARKGASLLQSLGTTPGFGFYLTNAQFSDDLWSAVINDDTRRSIGEYHPAKITTDYYERADTDDHLSKILYTDIKTYLPGDILVKVDRMSMAHSLEVRAPLLDYRLVEFAATIPSALKFDGREKKRIFKQSLAKLLPGEVLNRRKMGFSVPLDEWFRHGLREFARRQIFDATSGLPDLFRMQAIAGLWESHQAGARDYSAQLLSFLMFQLWWNRYMQ